MTDPEQAKGTEADVEIEKYKTRYGLYKVIFGTALVGILGVLIPGAIEFWRITFENQRISYQIEVENSRKNLEIEINQINQQQEYVKDFLQTALNQDIELRIRFTEYFSNVSAEPFREDWTKYRDALVKARNETRAEIHVKEEELLRIIPVSEPTIEQQIVAAKLNRELEWRYREIGYVARDRSIVRSESEEEDASRTPSALETILGSVNSFELVSRYAPNSHIGSISRRIGKVDVKYEGEKYVTCTGIIISESTILTASYCVEDSENRGKVAEIRFVYGFYDHQNLSNVLTFPIRVTPLKKDNDLWFAVLAVDEGVGDLPIESELKIRSPVVSEPALLLHHPGGQPMHLSRANCRVLHVTEKTLGHSCDTLPGSSGGGIFGEDGALIGMHYAGAAVTGPEAANYAVRLDGIRDSIGAKREFEQTP